MRDTNFEILGLTPAALPSPALAAATARAGGVGLLDLQFCADPALVRTHFQRLLGDTQGAIGLRVTADSAALGRELVAASGDRSLTLIVAGQPQALSAIRKKLAPRAQDRVLAEIASADALAALKDGFHGIVARGHESGGWVGEYTSYILLQKLAGQTALPVFAQGGIGVHSAAACRVAGAAGVILDDQMLLLAESPLPVALQNEFARLNGSETRLFGELLDHACRVYARPGSAALKTAEEDNRQAEGGLLALEAWQAKLGTMIGWSGDAGSLFPLGQGIGLASAFRRRYGSVARLIQAVRRASLQQIGQAAELQFIDEGGALAASHGTRFPLAQGPMTRVSDSPAFAVEVAKGGALPFLALALMRGPQVREMLEQTRDRIGDLPWGVGMLGFIPHSLREEQCAEIWKCKPPFALIAGGRPDQAAEFEKRGIKTYIHAPAPALLKMYLEQGARRFVFEGRECGGHIGPLASFTLWEEMIDVLLEHVPAAEAKDFHVLFAGGVHDARSGAMVAAMTAPLAARGMKVGALMGTAYLFTQEIVSSGAVVEGFQEQALACARTKNLETGPGHSTRCADTQFAAEFFDKRRELIRAGRSAEEIRDELEDLNLGRLRVASKGVNRDESGKIVEIDAATQLSEGMYMIGQVATLRDAPLTIEALHGDVCRGAQQLLGAEAGQVEPKKEPPSDVAIVGIGVVLPKADSADDYWNNVLNKVSVIREVPESRWDWKLFFDQNRKVRDKVYSRWGGFLEEIRFDPTRFGIPPKSMKSIDPMQLLALEGASRALDDAGYTRGGFDRETTSVILGSSGGAGELGLQYGLRAELPRFVENISDEVWQRLPEWTEESFAGVLPNVAAGRIANRLDFGGVNLTVDAACASSLAAISMAVNELESGRSSMVLAGGFDTTQSIYGFTTFAKTQALSPSGKPKTFDESADGIAISEGVAIVVLKRLADAERDGDRIYAVIKSTAGSSDGKALGLTAPRSEGQVRALHRAYGKAGFSPATLGLIEAHGTGTAVGDRAEAQTITRALALENAEPASVALGSVKTLLGHTKAAAGVAGMVKVALALYHRTLPAHVGVEKPIDTLADPKAAAYLLKEPRPWLAHPLHPRRGGASAFGFGGTNFHVVLEEHGASAGPAGARRWPQELCLFRAADTAALARELTALRGKLGSGSRVPLAELACLLARKAEAQGRQPVALAIVCTDITALSRDLDAVLAHLESGSDKPLPPHIRLARAVPAIAPAVAFLFPGQGAQHLNMGREAGLYIDEIREALEFADRQLADELPQRLSTLMMPPAAFDAATEAAQTRALTDTRVAQPAIGALSLGYLGLARRLGLEAVAAAGHSYGEYTALLAAGALDPAEFLQLSAVRGRAMAEASKVSEPGGMAAVQARREAVAAQLSGFAGVSIANHNAPEQCVISGPKTQVEQAAQQLSAAGLRATMLPVSGAFHTQLVAPAKTALSGAIQAARFNPTRFPVWSNQTGKPYPAKPAQMQALLDEHMLSPVEFVAEIEAMHAAGSRLFVELGPRGIVSNMAKATLAGRDAAAISLDGNGGGLRGLLSGLAELFVAGAAWQPTALFARRDLALLDEAQISALSTPLPTPKHLWMLSGGCARPIDDPLLRSNTLPPLTKDSADAARAEMERRIAASAPAALPTASFAAPAAPLAAAATAAVPAMAGEALVAYQQTMRQFLSLQERVLQQYLGGSPAALPAMPTTAQAMPVTPMALPAAAMPAVSPPASPTPPAAATPTPLQVAVAVSAPAFDAQQALLAIVAERTGYPPEMLGLDADLEADLGIDSIKRVEILGALQKLLPADTGAQMQATMERFTKAKSLNAILQALSALAPSAAPGGTATTASVAVTASAAVAAIATTPRYVIKSRPAPLPQKRAELSGLALLLGGPAEVAGELAAQLQGQGLTPVQIPATEPQALREAIAAARKQHGPARVLLHLYGLSPAEISDLAGWRERYRHDALSLYHGLQALEADLAKARVFAVSRFGGTFGRDSYSSGAAPGGAGNGLLNCLRQEYPEALMRAVDFDGQSDSELAALLAAELFADCGEPEIGYVGKLRHGSTTASQPLTPSPFPASVTPDGDWVVLVTGGARGITAEIVEELVRPGMRLVLLGRTAAPAAEAAETLEFKDAAQLKAGLLKQRLARGEKPKPVEIEREVARILVDREIRNNLARLSAAGANVEYLACDVRDEAALGAVLDRLYGEHGRIDAVLHGAGVIEDKLFADKTAESFERVLGTKLDAAFVLARRLRPDSLKLMAFFTSVAGRYGNRGQGDYAAANETLNRLAWQLHREWPQTRVIAVNWGPWDAGMASDSVRRAFRERGIEPIPVSSGRRFFLDEIAYGPRHDVEIVAGAGPWRGAEMEAEVPVATSSAPTLPLIQTAPRMGPGGNMMLDHSFSLGSDPYLLDHRIDGKGVLPAAGALEWMAQFVTAAWPGWHVVEMRDLRQLNSVMLDPEINGGKRSVQLRARASSHSDHNGQNITVEIIDPAKKLPFYRATAVLQQQMPEAPEIRVEALQQGKPFAASDAYAHFLFHGPRFQLVTTISRVSEEGLDAEVKPCRPTDWLPAAKGHWVFDPGLVDVPPQMALVWARLNRGMSALPSRFGAVLRYGNAAMPASLRLLMRMRPPPHEAAAVYDALFVDELGRLRLEMRDCESTMSAALNRLGGQASKPGQPNESA